MERKPPASAIRVDGAKVLIIAARYYTAIVDELIAGAEAAVAAAGAVSERIEVPGAFEAPGAVALAAQTGRYDGYVALGCVIRGETSHYDYVCGEVARGLMDLSVRERLAIGFGVLTVENEQQAVVRADRACGDKGGEAARACLAILDLARRFR
jgi:6,7-dimethyl-8-ribityllumazine synthase